MKSELREGYILTEEECVKKGGHKYEQHFSFYGSLHRTCKYCGHGQEGHVPEVIWGDVKDGD